MCDRRVQEPRECSELVMSLIWNIFVTVEQRQKAVLHMRRVFRTTYMSLMWNIFVTVGRRQKAILHMRSVSIAIAIDTLLLSPPML